MREGERERERKSEIPCVCERERENERKRLFNDKDLQAFVDHLIIFLSQNMKLSDQALG